MTGTETYVGIDVSKDRYDAAALPSGDRIGVVAADLQSLMNWLRRRRPTMIVLEATGGYERDLAMALAVTGPAFAGDVSKAKNEADCQKHGGVWNATSKLCEAKKM